MGELPLILSLDTATLGGSICLMRGEQELASIIGSAEISHSSTLLRDVGRVLETAGVTITDIGLFAVAAGPGSFTGLRIGIASVKAMAATLGRACVGVPTLHAVARAVGTSPATVALLPAGRGELFAQLLAVSSAGFVIEQDQPAHLPLAAILGRYGSMADLVWAGPGALAHREAIQAYAGSAGIDFGGDIGGWSVASKDENLALQVGLLALSQLVPDEQGAAESLRALYVRPSDPELKACR